MAEAIGPGVFCEWLGPQIPEADRIGLRVGDVRVCLEVRRIVFICADCEERQEAALSMEGSNGLVSCPNHWRPVHRPRPHAFDHLLKVPSELERA